MAYLPLSPLDHLSYSFVLSALLVFLFLSGLLLVTYRLFFHPLAQIPGPRLAAATQLYEFYYDVICKGQYMNQFEGFHEKYGPVVRISPNELHCNDPAFIDQIYAGSAGGKKRDKSVFYLNGTQVHGSCFGSVTHDLHRLRRQTLNPFFSKASVTRLEPMIREFVDKIYAHVESYAGTNEPCNVSHAFVCMTTDLISQYAFGWNRNYTGTRSFKPNLTAAMVAGEGTIKLFQHVPFLLPLFESSPEWVAKLAAPGSEEYLHYQREVYGTVDDVFEGKIDVRNTEKQKTIFGEILDADLPREEKSRQRLKGSAREVIGAGTVTTANALAYAVYYIIATPGVIDKLYAEIINAFPNATEIPSCKNLENLPYLITVLHETLRFSCGICTRLPRLAHEPLFYSGTFKGKHYDITIPPNTAIGMSAQLVHSNPDIFPEPEKFRPERWLDEKGKRHKELDGYLLAFSKGTRQCLGINLAWGEMHMALATFVQRFGKRVELFETGPEEVVYTCMSTHMVVTSGSDCISWLTYLDDLFEPGRETYNGVQILVH
ncbi:cytochrome P450 [Lindgomyces ingoldianus]|uniref:Cytochrome P450 n=1 Tax=Lindgomyces ingoldianus TaxID=673940 RepID=A0ACB6QQC3_9PLEO|nr:cytochrome P450 [Lindgomyces ingoldianus]KAF2469194.1 cytochrome P450 [Lindgomyces ingoldianus]